MRVEEIIGNDLNSVSKAVISSIEISSSFEPENFVVVPDRFSLMAEKLVFTELGICSTFNIKVLGISKLANFFVREQETCSQNESRLLVYQILKAEKFEFFEPNFELATELYKIISQFKSSNVFPNEVLTGAETQKQKEIAKIYEIYEVTKSKQDQSDVITNLTENLDVEKVSRCSFFFAGFDSLTSQGEKLLEKLCVFAKRVVVGAICPTMQKNSNLYDADINEKLKRISKNNKLEIVKSFLKNENSEFSNFILENLFSYSPKTLETSKVHLLEFETGEKEATEIAKTILFYVKKKNKRFSDFNIYYGNLEQNIGVLEKVFEKYEIPFFADCSTKFETLPLYNFFKNLFSFVQTEEEKSFLNILLNPYVNCPPDEISQIKNKFILLNKFKKEILKDFEFSNEIYSKIVKIREKTLNISKLSEFFELINEIFETFSIFEKNQNLVLQFSKTSLKNEKIYVQIPKIVADLCQSISFDLSLDFEGFSKLFLTLLAEKEISSVPISVDCVFVGADKTFFEERDFLFVANACYCALPKVVSNCGLFLDEDIASCAPKTEPTTRMINRRNKQKLLFDLRFKQEAFVSYHGSELGEKVEKSVLFMEFQKMFKFQNESLKIFPSFFAQFLEGNEFVDFEIQSEKDFRNKIVQLYEKNEISKENFEKYFECPKFQDEKISFASELFERFSPTGIESFFQCPFKHFLIKGLRIRENERGKFDGRDYGNFFHKVAEQFVSRNIKKLGSLDEAEILLELDKINSNIKKLPRFSVLSENVENSHIFEMLKREAKTLLEKINYEQRYSNFVAKFLEQSFSISLNEKQVVGSVDRIDFCDNLFRIVDYKSGEIKESLRAVYEGIELQLFIYIIATVEKIGGEPCGGFYLQINNDFKEKKEKFRLAGFLVGDEGVVKNLDRRLGRNLESDIVNIRLTSKSNSENMQLSTKKNVFSKKGFNAIVEYVKLLLKSAEKEILSGKIEARCVDEQICKNCKFFSICSFNRSGKENAITHVEIPDENDFIRIVENERN